MVFHVHTISVLSALLSPLVALCTGSSVFLLLYIGGPMSIRGEVSVGQIAAFIGLIAALFPIVLWDGCLVYGKGSGFFGEDLQIARCSCRTSRTRAIAKGDIYISKSNVVRSRTGVILTSVKGPSIDINNLSFAYPDDPQNNILKNISLQITSGSTVGIFGQTGSGKSTLLKILSRQYNPTSNAIFVDGTDITRLDLFAWRRKFAYVPQKSFLFSDTIRNNITMFQQSSDTKSTLLYNNHLLPQDLQLFPDGLLTMVGERGVMLSGGQRQRVALARGLFRGGDLIMLDDVLSAVDHENEKKLVQELSNLSSSDKANNRDFGIQSTVCVSVR